MRPTDTLASILADRWFNGQDFKLARKYSNPLGKSVGCFSMRRFFIVILILLFGVLPVRADSDRLLNSLKPAGYVSDFANVMTSADRAAVERTLTELEQKTGAQVAVVTLKSLEGGQIDDFASRLFARWGVG